MADRTTKLEMPFILPSQAQKHVTHNEALLVLDTVVQLTVAEDRADPPPSPPEGTCFLVKEAASGEWSGKEGQIASWQDGGWSFHQPLPGWRAWFATTGVLKVFWEDEWRSVLPLSPRFHGIGINADSNATNRLVVASPASLFDHTGSGHQMKINKAAAGDTGSLLFQTAYTGYAELGLAEDNAFSIKVSDGNMWKTALTIDAGGRHTRPNQPAMRAYRTGASITPADGQQTGFTHFGVNRGGFELSGSTSGGGSTILVPASGIYLASLQVRTASSSGHITAVAANGSASALQVAGASGSSGTLSASMIMELEAGDLLSLHHSGTATVMLGDDSTHLSLAML